MKKIVLLLALTALTVGCKKEKIEVVEAQPTSQELIKGTWDLDSTLYYMGSSYQGSTQDTDNHTYIYDGSVVTTTSTGNEDIYIGYSVAGEVVYYDNGFDETIESVDESSMCLSFLATSGTRHYKYFHKL